MPSLVLTLDGKVMARVLSRMLHALGLDTRLYSLHSLRRRGAMAAYRADPDQLNIKRHDIWSSNAFQPHV